MAKAMNRALCCGCGTQRTVSADYSFRRDDNKSCDDDDHWHPGHFWRMTGTLKCSARKAMTRHALLRDEDIPEHRDRAANRDASDDDCSSSLKKLTRVVPGSQALAPGVAGRKLVMRVELRTAPGCPNADTARQIVRECLDALGMNVPIIEKVGHYASPTVLIDGVDVMRSATGPLADDACRLDLPTSERVLDVLRRGEH